MKIENQLEEIRTELNSLSKKVIKIRFAYKALKKSYLENKPERELIKKVRPKKIGKRELDMIEKFERFAEE